MASQTDRASTFERLHKKGDPVVLYNIWDTGSAQAVAEAGAKAIATGSAPVAMAQGFADGQNFPFESALENARRIVAAVDLPVTMDLEGAYAEDPSGISENVQRALDTGVIGFNFEDQVVGTSDLYDPQVQARRVAAMRNGCETAGIPAFVNARTDLFLKAPVETHDARMLDLAIERARVYADAGADGFFAPGLRDEALIGALCQATDLPVNIIALPSTPPTSRLAALGVARVSYGPVPYRMMLAWLQEQARTALQADM